MAQMLKSLLTSKKAAAMVVGVIMSAFGKKMGLDEQAVLSIVGTIMAYLVGQGIADSGKSAAMVKENSK